MIEGLNQYPEYKSAGLPWLDAVPSHWDFAPNRALMRDRRDRVGEEASDYTLLSLTLRGVVARDMENPKGKFPAQFNTYKIVRPDDFVFCLFDIDETPRGVGLSGQRGMITGAYDVFSPTPRINPRFLYHYYLFVDEGKLMKPFYTGLRKTIQRGTFASLKAPLPPPDEQLAIVRFLDHANRKIDGFIRAKRKLIGLLNEQKQAIIHRTVTRGLNPNAKLKPSGNRWLGDIPSDWEMHRAKFIFEQVTPPIPENAGQVTCFRDGQVTLRSNRRTTGFTNAILELGYQGIRPGQLVLHSMDAFAGAIGICDSHGKCSPEYVICEPTMQGVFPPYYARLLRTLALQGLFVALCPSVRQRAPRVRFNDFGGFSLPKPPDEEQRRIVDHIESETKSLNTAIARTEREIALMQEYRTRLTADIVTGKLDVREAAAKLPEVADFVIADADVSPDETESEDAET